MSLLEGVRHGTLEGQHVKAMWFERVSRLDAKGSAYLSHVMVVETDLLSDSDMLETGALDDLDHELRDKYDQRDEIRFVPSGRYSKKD